MSALPIGVFDSGVGGLTVLKALQAVLPNESFVYLGDTARLPYGTKSPETVARYALQASDALMAHTPIKALVVACNTASALAYDALVEHHQDLLVIDVVRPGAQAAVDRSVNGDIAVIATEATVRAEGYQKAIKALNPNAQVHAHSASVLVALAEEGWCDNDVAVAAVEHYLRPLLEEDAAFKPDCLLLGCTHFPVLLPAIEMVINESIHIVDSATATAMSVARQLAEANLLCANGVSKTDFLVTDSPARFARVAKQFLGVTLSESDVQTCHLG
ncbi:MAG: glutamate racemase [Gammaproteobacteria bacterium CG11_big_fil_rev_8_21_14_0_20_46_22]|nr:MAG: glutamate racemase [Gammaproteobacteria bacterium CG12_big_fil_rev_8_21_14_0_65_46_12]PIR11648.1 MAG: glutamate racemase [Gammaproteobacteria bacterium CG11_big_fil_rev_8_21_14_0_20_46_22]